MRRLFITLITLVLLAAACTSDGNDSVDGGSSSTTDSTIDIGTPGIDIGLISSLAPFDSCDAFLDHVKSNALEVVGPWGLDNGWHGGPWRGFDDVMEDSDDSGTSPATVQAGEAMASDGDASGSRTGGVDFSGTNVQETGVDEPDLVKTDGERMLVIAEGVLHLLDVTGPSPELVDSLALPVDTWVEEMLFSGDTVLLLSHTNQWNVLPLADARSGIAPTGSAISTLIEVSIDGSSLSTQRRLHLGGWYLSSRMIDGVARIVVQSGPVGFEWAYPEYGGSGLEAQREAEDAEENATEANRDLIRNSTVANWLPYYVLENAEGSVLDEGTLVDCEQAYHPTDFSGLNMLNVVTIDLGAGALSEPDAVSVMADGQTVYASTESLYVATTEWIDWNDYYDEEGNPRDDVPEVTTALHRFDISDPVRTDYLASGSVPGTVLNQYSLSEHEGRLRIATTHDPVNWTERDQSSSSLYVLETVASDGGAVLQVVGKVDNLGQGERIFAVRFLGDLATVVTFRQTDPLYTIDLTDPTNPQVLGELKINGYSAYLHPLGNDMLLGVGQDATDEGRTTGTQVSLFDISDRANPTRVAQWSLDNAYSDTEWDARAFLWWPQDELVVIPVNSYGWNDEDGVEESFFGAIGLRVSDGTITEIGRISQQETTLMRECYGPEGWSIERINPDGSIELIEAFDDSGQPLEEPVAEPTEITDDEASSSDAIAPEEAEPVAIEAPPSDENECHTWVESDWRAQIRRTVVVGDQLHTIAEKGILTVDIDNFGEIGRVNFPERRY